MDIDGKAILFESGIYAKIPNDLPENLALSALDVAGAPAQTAKLVKPGDTVVIIGAGGKSGMLCCYEAKKRAGVTGKVIGICHSEKSTKRMLDLGFCDEVFAADATQPVPVMKKIEEMTNGQMADICSKWQHKRIHLADILGDFVLACVVKTHSVLNALLLHKPKQTRFVVALLRLWRERAKFQKAKA